MTDDKAPAQPALLSMSIPDRSALYAAYMPFVKGGGLFVPTTAEFALGDNVLLLLTYEQERFSINGRVVWINPRAAQGRRRQGVGVQFSADNSEEQRSFESILAGMLTADKPTDTM